MMTSPDCNAKLIEECTEVHVVDIAYIKADNGISTIPSMPIDVHSFYLTQLLKGIMCEVLLMRKDVIHSQSRDIIEGFGKS